MNPSPRWLTAAAIAAAVAAFSTSTTRAADDDVKVQRTETKADASSASAGTAAFPAGVKAREAEDPADIHRTFTGLAGAALARNGFDDVVERLVDQDRNRIGKYAEKEFDDLNAAAEAINKAWKDKYGQDFKLEPDALKSVSILRGEIEDPKAVAAAWPVKAVAPQAGERDAVAAAAAEKADRENEKGNANPNLNSNIEKGRDVAIATVPASHGLPAIRVSLVREANGWRVDVPNNLTGEQLKNNFARHLAHIKDSTDRWPADKNDAAAMVAHHALMAAYNVEPPAGQRQ